jgi:hypothetical protein
LVNYEHPVSSNEPRLQVVFLDFSIECSFSDDEDFCGFFAVGLGFGQGLIRDSDVTML